jgi:hypothetical protein
MASNGEKTNPPSVVALKKELSALGDTDFTKDELYFFRLGVPSGVTPDYKAAVYTTPLMVNPQSITLSEPYAMTPTATIGGGLFIEEEGVIARQLRITGTTGFKQRLAPPGTGWGAPLPHNCSDWRRTQVEKTLTAGKQASGQRQFQFLQDRVFRLYSQLKKNPETSMDTYLSFHMPKDGEHYQVVPINFTLQRTVPRSTMYFYDIQLLVVGPAAGARPLPKRPYKKEKKDKELASANKVTTGCIQRLRNSLQELNDVIGEIQGEFNSFNNVVRQVESLVEGTTQLITGFVSVLSLPLTTAVQVIDSINAMIPLIENWGGARPGLYNILDTVGDLGRAVERTAVALREFDGTVPQSRLDQVGRNWNFSGSTTPGIASSNSLQGLLNQGTGPQAGDASRDRGNPISPNPGGNLGGSVSTQEGTVFQNDTIQTVAARTLGDAERASELIALNGLRPPYISTTGLPGTLRPGDIILIPSRQNASVTLGATGPTVLGARPTDAIETRTLGTDLRLDPINGVVGEPLYDLVLAGSTTDIVAVSGVDNLKQGLRSRILTELGDNTLFPAVGMERVVGLSATDFQLSMEELSIVSAIEADERITSTQNVQVSQPTPDSLVVDFDATVINLQDQVQVRIAK